MENWKELDTYKGLKSYKMISKIYELVSLRRVYGAIIYGRTVKKYPSSENLYHPYKDSQDRRVKNGRAFKCNGFSASFPTGQSIS